MPIFHSNKNFERFVRQYNLINFFKRFPKIRKGEENVEEMIAQMKGLKVGGIRRLSGSVEDRKREKRVLTQREMGRRLNETAERGSQTLQGFTTSADPSIIPYR